MTEHKYNKFRTELVSFLQQHHKKHDEIITMSDVFFDPSGNSQSLRVTRFGARLMKKHFDHETFTFDKSVVINYHVLMKLAKKLRAPYQFDPSLNKITLFSDEDIVMFKMVDDFKTWLDML